MNRGYVHGIAAPPPAPTLLPPVSAIPMQRGFPTRALLGHWNVTTDPRLEIVVLGDSIASGQGATSNASSWVGRLRARLQQQYGGNGGEGFIGPYDTRVTKTGWGLISSLPPWNGCYSNNDSSSNLMTYTFTGGQVIDRVDVFYADAGDTTNFDPNIEIRHNAGSYSSYTQVRTGPAYTIRKISHSLGSAVTDPVIDIHTPTNKRLFFVGMAVYNGTSGVVVHNVSRAGGGWVSQDANHVGLFTDNALSPHLAILALSTNDHASNRATVIAAVDRTVTAFKALTAKGTCDILGVLGHGYTNQEAGLQDVENLVKTRFEIAGIPWASVRDWWISNQQAVADARSSDGIHPSEKGHLDMAAAIYRTLTAA